MAELFDIGNESDLTGWTSTVTSGGSIVQSGGSALGGTSGGIELQRPSGSTSSQYLVKTFTALTSQTDFRVRWYVDQNTHTQTNNDIHNFLEVYSASDASTRIRLSLLYLTTPKYRLGLNLRNDAGSETSGTYDIGEPWTFDYIEIHCQKASNGTGANDAFCKLYLDGVERISVTGVDLFDLFDFDELRIGHCAGLETGVTGTMYLDEVVARDDATEIGAVAVAPVNTVPVHTLGIYMTSDSATQISSVSPSTAISVVDAAGLTTCRVYCTSGDLTVTLSGSVVISAGANGSSDLTLGSGASTAEFNTVLATLTYQGDADFHGTDTINVVSTGTGGSDTDTFNVLNDPRSITLTATEPNFSSLVAATASTEMRIDEGRQSAICTVTATDDDALTDVQIITLEIAPSTSVFPYRNLAVPTARRDRR